MHRSILTVLVFLSAITGFAQTTSVRSGETAFAIKYWAGTCKGTFDAPVGKVMFNPANLPASKIDVTIFSGSFHTANRMRDRHMKKAKYLDAQAFPAIRFTSDNITASGGTYYASGKMEIKGISRDVTLPFKAKKQDDGSYAVTSTFDLNRLDYKVGKPTPALKNNVAITVSAVIR